MSLRSPDRFLPAMALAGLTILAVRPAAAQPGPEQPLRVELDVPVQQQQLNAAQQLYDVLVSNVPNDAATGGATLEPVDDSLRAQLDLPKGQGLVVAGLNPGSPAVEAGLQANDILLKLADTPLAAPDDVAKGLKAAGEKDVPLEIIRGGKRETLRVRPRYRVTFGPARTEKRDFFIGVEVRPLDDAMRSHLSLAAGQGLVATRIIDDSPALKAGLKPHDILMKLGDKPLADTETLVAQVQASQGKPVDLEIVRGGKTMTIPVTPVPRPVMPEEAQWIQSQHVKLYQVPHGLSGHSETQALQGWVQSRAAPQQAHLRYMEALQNAHAPGGASPLDKKLDTLIEEVKRLRKEVEELKSAKK